MCYYISYIGVKRTFILIFALRKSNRSLLQTKRNDKRLSQYFVVRPACRWLKCLRSIDCCFTWKSNRSWKYYISFLVDVSLLEKETAKISSQRKFQSIRAAKICCRIPKKIANPQNKSPAKISCYTVALGIFLVLKTPIPYFRGFQKMRTRSIYFLRY